MKQERFYTAGMTDDAIRQATGYGTLELLAEAISDERHVARESGKSAGYHKLLLAVFNKFAVDAPTAIFNEAAQNLPSREEMLEKIKAYNVAARIKPGVMAISETANDSESK